MRKVVEGSVIATPVWGVGRGHHARVPLPSHRSGVSSALQHLCHPGHILRDSSVVVARAPQTLAYMYRQPSRLHASPRWRAVLMHVVTCQMNPVLDLQGDQEGGGGEGGTSNHGVVLGEKRVRVNEAKCSRN